MDNQQVTDLELGWLVGAIDGEGCVGITRRNRKECAKTLGFTLKPHVQIANCDIEFINRCSNILKKLETPFHISHYSAKTRQRESWQIVIAGLKRVVKILPIINPHLVGEKKEKALLVYEFCTSRLSDWHAAPFTKRELDLYNQVALLNRKGHKSQDLRDYTRNSRSSKFPRKDIVQTTTE